MSAAVHTCDLPFCDGTECGGDVPARGLTVVLDPFTSLGGPEPKVTDPEEPGVPVRGRPITGDGMHAIRRWVLAVNQHFGGQNMATCHYAGLIGYYAHLKTFAVTTSDRTVAEEAGIHRNRLNGHARRLADAGFLVSGGTRGQRRSPRFTLATPDVPTGESGAPW